MEEHESADKFLPPVHTNTFCIPNDAKLLANYEVYKPSLETRKLKSEHGRNIFAETFLESPTLGTLADLAVRAMAVSFGPIDLPPIVSKDPVKLRIYYDAVSVDLPLEKCYNINDDKYWRRVVLAKSNDKTLVFKESYNWKNLGVSLKYVELVEACPAEYWPEEEMLALGLKVKDFIVELNIRKLQSLNDNSFKKYFESESDNSEEESELSSDLSTSSATEEPSEHSEGHEKTEEELEYEKSEAKRKADEKAERFAIREAKRKKREAREERRKRREAKRPPPPPPPPVKGRRKPRPKGFFDIPFEEPEDDGEDDIVDKRNLDKLLDKHKRYKYPVEDCHHIDLSFIRIFDNLETFTIEFQAPEMQRNFHTRHFNFSYDDVQHLAFGLSLLEKLKTFRLRNSRMDTVKLSILVKSLKKLEQLETIDFGYDQLDDSCGNSIYQLFEVTTSLKNLELESNSFSTNVIQKLAEALVKYEGELEYLGLARNPLGDEALHILATALLGTEHVNHLCLTGTMISQEGIVCCIANELLKQHTVLKQLDLSGIPIGWRAGNELLKAFQTNLKVISMDCRGCGLDDDMEYEVQVMLSRNRYVVENPYIGDRTKTEEEINEWVDRIKNPVYLAALEEVEKRADCRSRQTDEYIRSYASLDKLNNSMEDINEQHYDSDRDSFEMAPVEREPFVFDPNNLDEEGFMRHVYLPGPNQRYYFFQEGMALLRKNTKD